MYKRQEDDGRFNRFMVGDVKQSIYKFRLARPELFLEKFATYQKEDGSCVRVDLKQNFRSRHEVTDCVNDLFLPVSYTHLDVYKRQKLQFTRGFAFTASMLA